VCGMRGQPVSDGGARGVGSEEQGRNQMMRLIKFLLILGGLGLLGLIGFAYLGDLSPTQSDVKHPVTLDAN
jgi:hypothetical protein